MVRHKGMGFEEVGRDGVGWIFGYGEELKDAAIDCLKRKERDVFR